MNGRHGDNFAGYHTESKQDWYLEHGYKTWGWPIYRPCYDDDAKWEVFKSRFEHFLLWDMSRCFPPEEADERSKYLNFPIWEDQSRFEGPSTAQLRTHYAKYRASAAPFRKLGHPNLSGGERQQFFWKSYGRYDWFLVADTAAINLSWVHPKGVPHGSRRRRRGSMS
jgi:hypothetical protein